MQSLDDWFGQFFKISERIPIVRHNKAEIQVPEIMIDCTAAAEPTNDMDPMFIHIFLIDLFDRILIASNDNRWFINVKSKMGSSTFIS